MSSLIAYNARPLLLAQASVRIWGKLSMAEGLEAPFLDADHSPLIVDRGVRGIAVVLLCRQLHCGSLSLRYRKKAATKEERGGETGDGYSLIDYMVSRVPH